MHSRLLHAYTVRPMFLRIALQRSSQPAAAAKSCHQGIYWKAATTTQPWGLLCRHASLPRLNGLTRQEIAAAEYVYGSAPTPIKELVHLRDVIYLLNLTNEMAVKKLLLKRFAVDLRDMLLFIYNPRVRFHVKSDTLLRYTERQREERGGGSSSIVSLTETRFEYDSLLPLLKDLELDEVTGNARMGKLSSFLLAIEPHEERVRNTELRQKATLQDVFFRLLDRNLRAGISANTIQSVFDNEAPESKKLIKIRAHLRKSITHYLEGVAVGAEVDPKIQFAGIASNLPVILRPGERERKTNEAPENVQQEQEPPAKLSEDKWGVALGKSCTLDELDSLFSKFKAQSRQGVDTWYMSRKLDGVRCIIRVEIDVDPSDGRSYQVTNVEALSRAGNKFTSLGVLTRNLASLLGTSEAVQELVQRESSSSSSSSSSALQKFTLYLDGEVCALLPEVEGDDAYTEDFQAIVGLVRRKDYEIETPAYFPFDILTQSEFEDWQSVNGHRHDPFYLRKKRLESFTAHCQKEGSIFVRALEQTVVSSADQVKAASQEAAQKGWEGLILRRGCQYEGKRTTAIRKLKHWQEDEYMVTGVQNAIMRMPVDQVYEDREGLASVMIRHAGHEVSVGSGFTVEERLRYGQDPASLIGKYITVQYFGESTSVKRVGQASLRFPRVKKVWEDGQRDV